MVYVKPEVLAQKAARRVFAAGQQRIMPKPCVDE